MKIDATLFQGLTSKNFSGSTDTEDSTNQDDNGGKNHNAGDRGWTIGFESMYDPTHTNGGQALLDAWKNGTEVDVLMEGDTSGDVTIAGKATITQIDFDAAHGSSSTFKGTLTGKGLPTFGTVA
uniref:phage tail tube protein n=1 Tax=uncultured Draconibacterium sp. TaxID=1573823 RepID=UPI003216522A